MAEKEWSEPIYCECAIAGCDAVAFIRETHFWKSSDKSGTTVVAKVLCRKGHAYVKPLDQVEIRMPVDGLQYG